LRVVPEGLEAGEVLEAAALRIEERLVVEGQIALRRLLDRMPGMRMAAARRTLRWRKGLNLW